MSSIAAKFRNSYREATHFFRRGVWDTRLSDLPARRARLYAAARILHCTVKSLVFGDTLHVRAAALTYFTVLSLVPLLAFAFALLKGFGAYDVLIRDTIRPYVLHMLEGNEALRTAFERILGFVEQTGVTSLGFVGLLALLYAATRLLRNIEAALNEIWGARTSRQPLQQLRDYVSIIFVTPICLLAGAALTTAGQVVTLLRAAGESLGLGGLLDSLLGVLGPVVVLFGGLFFLYKVMPYTSVRPSSAAIGAIIAALLWFVVLIAHVRFQVGVAQYNALYSSFGAIPIFLAWLHISWLVVMVGAQIGATHQHGRSLAEKARMAQVDQAAREAIALAASLRIAECFLKCERPCSLGELSDALDASEPLLADVIDKMVAGGLVLRVTVTDGADAYVLARPPRFVRIKEVLDALRSTDPSPRPSSTQEGDFRALAQTLWDALDDAATRASANQSLEQVLAAQRSAPRESLAQVASAPRA